MLQNLINTTVKTMDTVQELNIQEGKFIVKALKLLLPWIINHVINLETPEGPQRTCSRSVDIYKTILKIQTYSTYFKCISQRGTFCTFKIYRNCLGSWKLKTAFRNSMRWPYFIKSPMKGEHLLTSLNLVYPLSEYFNL